MSEYLLEMKNITKSFFGVTVLQGINFQVKAGEVHVLLGENGAGKSTLIKVLSSAYRFEEGEILLEGKPFAAADPKEAIEKGISVVYQEFNLNPNTAIYENIFQGREIKKGKFTLDQAEMIRKTREYMKQIGFEGDPRTLVEDLSVAQKQMVEIMKAVSTNAKILVLDEPTAAITDKETEMLFKIVRELKAKGLGIVYISHRMEELFEIGDRCTVMRDGLAVKTLELAESNVDNLTELMVGRRVTFDKIENPHVDYSDTVLKVEGLCYRNLLKDISFELHKGEILGFAGLVGAGRTEVAKCIIGAYQYETGSVEHKVGGALRPMKKHSIQSAIDEGIVYLSEDRKDEGLILMHDLQENICLPSLKKFHPKRLDQKAMSQCAEEYIKKLRVKTTSSRQLAQELSGGNQQKVVIAKWLATDADIYIFDEPTRGIDVGARDEIYTIMQEIIAKGSSIIMISSDLVEVLKMCDRVAVMSEGRLVQTLENDGNLTQKEVLKYAFAEVHM